MTTENLNNHSLELVERIIAKILAVGIFLTSFFYVAGLILITTKQVPVDIYQFSFRNISEFFNGFAALNPKPFLFTGTLVLIFTPIFRVILSIYLFVKKKESKFVFITSVVAFIIAVSVLMGIVFSLKLG